jgi:hypothetical protein
MGDVIPFVRRRAIARDEDLREVINREIVPGLVGTRNRAAQRLGYAVTVTADYEVESGVGLVLADATDGAITVTLPDATAGEFEVVVKKTDSSLNLVTLSTGTTTTIDGASTQSIAAQWDSVTVQSDLANWYIT